MYEARSLKECLENVSPPPHSPSAQNKGSLPMGRGGMNVGWDQGRMEVGQELGGGGGGGDKGRSGAMVRWGQARMEVGKSVGGSVEVGVGQR